MLCIIAFFILFILNNINFSLVFLLIALYLVITKKSYLNIKSVIFIFLLMSYIFIYCLFITNGKIFYMNLIEEQLNFSLRNNIVNYIYSNNDKRIADFINLTLFNTKIDFGKQIYKDMIELSVSYLIVISGMHLSFISRVIEKFIKHKKISFVFNIIIFSWITYFLNFSYSILRVFISYLISKNRYLNKYDSINKLCICSLILILINPNCVNNISFQLTMLASLSIIWFNKISKNFWFKSIFLHIFINVLIFPVMVNINSNFSLMAFVYSCLFSWMYLFNFICILFLFYIPHIGYVLFINYYLVRFTLEIFLPINIKINLYFLKDYCLPWYYLFILCINNLIMYISKDYRLFFNK